MSSVSNQIKISAFYVAVFNRAPDVSGLNYWLGQISGASADSVFDRFKGLAFPFPVTQQCL
jgi:hypothetical protein